MLKAISENTTIKELLELAELSIVKDYLVTPMNDSVKTSTIASCGNDKCDIISGLNRIYQVSTELENMIFDIYSPSELEESSDRKEAKLIFMPGESQKPFVLICPGGSYSRLWVLTEGYPIASQLNQIGYSAFILIYRTNQTNLFPKPLEDIAHALTFIQNHRDIFQVSLDKYAVAGFSAGGHLAAEWGTKNLGFRQYHLPAPAALFLAYPSISTDIFYNALKNLDEASASACKLYLERIAGTNLTRDSVRKYSVEFQMDSFYPPTYLLHCKDDPLVPFSGSIQMDQALTQYHIPHIFRLSEQGGHGFGLGNGTDADGWLKQAVKFWKHFL